MAVMRDAQDVNFGATPDAGAAPNAVPFKQPDVDKFRTGPANSAPLVPTVSDQFIGALLKPVQQIGMNKLNQSREEAYLAGQAAAGAGLAQESVDSNIFTKDWATAGYRDTRGRLALADAEAQTSKDMIRLREQSPEQFAAYLAQRRQSLMPSLEGMSLEARKGFMQQQLVSDRAAITKHAMEHQKFVVDQIGKSVQTDLSVRYDAMDAAKTDPASYLTAADNAFAGLYNNIWSNPNLPEDMRIKMTTEAGEAALSRNHQVLYERMKSTPLPNGQGTMLSRLPFDDQVKLQKKYNQSLDDTKAMRLADYQSQRGLMEAAFDDPNVPALPYNEFNAFVQKGVQIGAVSASDITSLNKAWANGNEKKMGAIGLAEAYAAGDVNKMFSMGKDESKGLEAYVQMQARNGVPIQNTVGNLLNIGVTTGQQTAFKAVGSLTRSAVSQIGMGDKMDPGQLESLNTVLKQIDNAQVKGNAGAMSAYLSAFGDEERTKIMMFREGLQKGQAPLVAAANAADAVAKTSQLTEGEKNALAVSHVTADRKAIAEIEPRGLWGTLKSYVPDFLRSNDAVNKDKITTGRMWFENEERVAEALGQSKAAMMEELNYISRSNPYMSDDARKSLALAKVAERTIDLNGGPLVLPRLPSGVSSQDFFGVPRSVSPDTIAATLNDLHKPGKDNRIVYKANGQAQIQWQEFGKDGSLVNAGGTFDPKSIAQAVQDRQDKIADGFQRTDGRGVTVKGPDGSAVTFNGNNTVGVGNLAMVEFRENLAKHEGVRNTPYDDASGKIVDGKRVQTVGVGVSSHNPAFPQPGPDGKVPDAAISDSFMRASNIAARTGVMTQRETQMNNSAAFKLYAEMAYQGGDNFANVNQPAKDFISAMKNRDVDAALAALQQTTPYRMAHDARRKSYEQLTRQAIQLSRS
ncbi:internal virion lysozyme motif [Ralstonia phage phiAp1]|uniref:Internal virion protein n=1 Tax=Ralstonia phage phiAp1 TaxID=2783867 RepID=A0A1L7DS81_9CAUD|nr:internal virion lysozyme motif [Ralstonia phage phiAp1]APU03186.1 internal virion protein [Ralstonia phage phiAp1]